VIPRVEDILVTELERRIAAAIPDTRPSDGEEPETFVISIEGRTVTRSVQEQSGLTAYAWVTAEIAVVFFSQKKRYDYSALIADLARNPMIELGETLYARVEIERSEAVEGPYLSNDAWLFTAAYPVVEIEERQVWQRPRIGNVTPRNPDQREGPYTCFHTPEGLSGEGRTRPSEGLTGQGACPLGTLPLE
jgi:hypothetical protein